MFKRLVLVTLSFVIVIGFSSCGKTKGAENRNKMEVVVTFDAMKEFVQAIGKDKVDILTIIPDGTEPHNFEPKAKDLMTLKYAKVFVYNGFGLESWVNEAMKASDNKDLIFVKASKDATPINVPEDKLGTVQNDPHIWLSLKGAEIEAKNIKEGLQKADSVNKDYYENNCNEFISNLEGLYKNYDTKFKSVDKKTFVTGHAAFAYLCRDFGLKQNSVEDVFAEGEPSAAQLASLVNFCKKNNVKTIFAEAMASPDVSRTLADEVGAKIETIYTMESADGTMTYLYRMEYNLKKIYESLSS